MIIKDIGVNRVVEFLKAEIATSRHSIDEIIDTFINGATAEACTIILDACGDVDLSEPKPDLTAGWFRVRKQLAYNALFAAVANMKDSNG